MSLTVGWAEFDIGVGLPQNRAVPGYLGIVHVTLATNASPTTISIRPFVNMNCTLGKFAMPMSPIKVVSGSTSLVNSHLDD